MPKLIMQSGLRHILANVALAAVTLVICIVVLEWALRSFVFDPTRPYIRVPGWAMPVRTNDLVPNVTGDHVYLTNRLGFRGDLPSLGASPKIAVLGGSTAEDWVLEESETWAQQLAAQLRNCAPNVWVGNLAKSGVNGRHHLIQLPEIVPYMPRFEFFVVLIGLNDFLYDLRIHHSIETPPDWWRRQAFAYLPGDEGMLAISALTKRLYKSFMDAGRPASDYGVYQKSLRDAHATVKPSQWVREMPDISSHLAIYRQTIRSLRDFAARYGAKIVFVTQPLIWSDDMPAEAREMIFAGFIGADMTSESTKWYTSSALRDGLSAYNNALREMCKSDELICVDAEAALGRNPRFFYDDFHFSEAGATKIATVVAETLRRQIASCEAPDGGRPGAYQ